MMGVPELKQLPLAGVCMSSPYQFLSEEELVNRLQSEETQAIASVDFEAKKITLADVVRKQVSASTFRAFRNLPRGKPSTIFRDWAIAHLERSMSFFRGVSTADEYSQFVHSSTLSLCEYWRSNTGAELGYGRGAKLLNLVLKKVVCLDDLSPMQRKTLISLLHVPLDSYTIVGLRRIAPELRIPCAATMGYITSQQQYAVFQKRITSITANANVPAIYYEILAWNMKERR